jgi:hypothetical protein
MSSEREKLIEIWLDNAGERQYQFAFRNALLWAGYTILHDTSHTALELGKDIVALSPNGELFAYQLKGNPNGRVTVSQWQGLIAQINTLIYQPISHPSIKPGTPHTPVFVTNGEIHEDVYAAITGLNSSVVGPNARPLQTIARGQLLKHIVDAADTLWPVDVRTQRNVLNIYASRGDDELPAAEFVSILSDTFSSNKYNDTAIPAMHLVTAILSSNWIEHDNYFELIKMYSMLAVSSTCYQSRWKRMRRRDSKFVEEILFDLKSHLRRFILELMVKYEEKPLINRDIFAEFAYYHPRKKMLTGLVSAAMLDNTIEFDDATKDFMWEFVCSTRHSAFLLWEGMVPFCLAEFWALSNIQGTIEPHRRLFSLVNDILHCNGSDSVELQHLPGPYYSLRQVVEHKYKDFLGVQRSEIDLDNHRRRSWFAEPLFLLLVRRNYKSSCQLIWPSLTTFLHSRTRLQSDADFGPSASSTAIAEDKLLDTNIQKSWDDVVADAKQTNLPLIPAQLLRKPHLVLLYCLFVPQRMDPDIILWLDREFCRTWY